MILTEAGKTFGKIQYQFMVKKKKLKIGIKGELP